MTVYVDQTPNWVQGYSYIGYENFVHNSLHFGSSQDAGYSSLNVGTWDTYKQWRTTLNGGEFIQYVLPSAAREVNCYGVHRHNLGDDGVTSYFEHSTDGATWTKVSTGGDMDHTFSSDNETIFYVTETPVTDDYFRVRFDIPNEQGNVTYRIGNIFVGNALKLFNPPAAGFTPPQLAFEDKYLTNESDGGDFLGRSLIRKAGKTGFSMRPVAESWVNSDWKSCMEAIAQTPFYFAWDTLNHKTSAAFCYTEGKVSKPKYIGSKYFQVSLAFRALTA